MSYMKIQNLYKTRDILLFRECWALEKIHGTSAHLALRADGLHYFAGCVSHEQFSALFSPDMAERMGVIAPEFTIYGEAYGGKCQKMSATYGKALRFVAFEVRIGTSWLSVPDAEQVAKDVGLDFVPYERCSTDLDALDALRDADSEQAVRNGMGAGHKREGIVLRPMIELRKNNGERIIAKHKSELFRETKTPRAVTTDALQVLSDAEKIAHEWVTNMRLAHILDAFPGAGIETTGDIVRAMTADVLKESAGEIVDTKEARKAIGKRAAELFREHLNLRKKEG